MLDDATIRGAIGAGQGHLKQSPTRGQGYSNYRTSSTARLDDEVIRKRVWQASRLPRLSNIEVPQLLRYRPQQFYKKHRDTFYDYVPPNGKRPAQRLQEWLQWLRSVLSVAPEHEKATLPEQLRLDVAPLHEFHRSLANLLVEQDIEHLGAELVDWLRDNIARNAEAL